MRNKLIFGVLSLFLLISYSCKKANPANKLVSEAEAAFKANPNDTSYAKLINAYKSQLAELQNDKKAVEDIFVKGLKAAEQMKDPMTSVLFTNNLLKQYPDRKDSPDNVLKMVDYLQQLNKSEASNVLKIGFCRAYPNDARTAEISKTLVMPSDSLEKYIMSVGMQIFNDTTHGFSEEAARRYVDACEAYAMVLPKDANTPEMLFKAAETSNTLKTYEKSFELYDMIINNYPEHKRAPYCLFMKAFTFDSNIKDTAMARKFYLEFLEKYPKHELMRDAKTLMNYLGKSEEEILNDITRKAKENN